jgi:hypothetical protein
MVYKFALYYEKDAEYSEEIPKIEAFLEEIKQRWKVEYHLIEAHHLSPLQIDQLKNNMRSILPQMRGKIVSSRNRVLPLSKTKNPNLTNTPILLLFRDDMPVNVFPHLLGTTYFDIETSLESIVKDGPKAHLAVKGLLEQPIQKILADDPEIIEKGMKFLGVDVETENGVIDLLLQDPENRTAVVEIETRASEPAVAQVSRLAVGYLTKTKINQDKIRKLIVCEQFDENTASACQGAGVELYKVDIRRIV